MISSRKIDEWIQEVEKRPASAPEIIRLIASRLGELDRMNEELRDENIQLRLGKRIEEYQRRIENLEYQIELLKRQFSPVTEQETFIPNLVLFNPRGQVLRIEVDFEEAGSGNLVGRFHRAFGDDNRSPHMLLVEEKEEALFLFDSGRVSTMPVTQIPRINPQELDWDDALLKEPGIGEELAAIIPSARMSLYEFCIQASRRGFVRKIVESFFESHLTRGFIGSGVTLESDKACGLSFGDRQDLFVMVSREGMVFSMEVAQIPPTVEEAIRLVPSDRIITVFTPREESSIGFITQSGKVIQRDIGWLEPVSSLKAKGQAIISKERRERGVRLICAAPASEEDWGVALLANGQISAYQLGELFEKGSIMSEGSDVEFLNFAILNRQTSENT